MVSIGGPICGIRGVRYRLRSVIMRVVFFFFQAEDGIRDLIVTGVQTCALPIYRRTPAVGADDPEDRTAQFKFEDIGAVAPRFGRDAEQRPAQYRVECRAEDLAFRLRFPTRSFRETVRVGTRKNDCALAGTDLTLAIADSDLQARSRFGFDELAQLLRWNERINIAVDGLSDEGDGDV